MRTAGLNGEQLAQVGILVEQNQDVMHLKCDVLTATNIEFVRQTITRFERSSAEGEVDRQVRDLPTIFRSG